MSQDSMTSGWYYAKAGSAAGREVGPLSWDELYRLAESGVVDASDIVWNPRLPRGMTAAMIPELFPSRQVVQTPVAQAPPLPRPAPAPPTPPVLQPTPPAPAPQPAGESAPQPAPPAPPTSAEAAPPAPQPVVSDGATEESADESVADEAKKKRKRTRVKEKSSEPGSHTQRSSLPALILLLVAVIAAAGLTTYFLYFRDVGSQGTGEQGMRCEPSIVTSVDDGLLADASFIP